MSAPAMDLLVPGDPDAVTGGYLYDRQIVSGLRRLGWQATVHALDASFPFPGRRARAQMRAVLAALPAGRLVVIDGLALAGASAVLATQARRLRLVALVHHPLAMESGLTDEQSRALTAEERASLARVAAVVTTSAWTGSVLEDLYGVPGDRIRVVEPGVPPAPAAAGSATGPLRLLCVATLIPRKGHARLLEALARLRDRPWQLECVGSATRDARTAAALRRLLCQLDLEERVFLRGEVDTATLNACYHAADLFVLASSLEGYGMALAEALRRGIPIVSTSAAAIPGTVPAEAGLLVPPGDEPALVEALRRFMDEPATRQRLARGARAAASRLPDWEVASRRFATALAAVPDS